VGLAWRVARRGGKCYAGHISTIALKLKSGNQALVAAVFLVIGSLLSGTWLSVRSEVLENSRVFSGSVLVQTAQAQDSLPVASAVDGAVFAGLPAVVADHAAGNNFSFQTDDNGIIEDSESPIGFVSASEGLISANGITKSDESSNFSGNFVIPVRGRVVRGLRDDGVADIVAACGIPVVAAADGLVVPDQKNLDNLGSSGGGSDNSILLEHSFGEGIFTRYTHLGQLSINIGDYVKQGQQIGLVGKSGLAASCRFGFTVIGSENPFAKK
jgi:murein DD-endopeptidase MepM/ murein hydrolase activator NlpD